MLLKHTTTRVLFFMAILAIGSLVGNAFLARADTSVAPFFFPGEGKAQCGSMAASICPFGSELLSESDSGEIFYCMEKNSKVGNTIGGSKYCQLMTGKPGINFDEGYNQYVCDEPITGSYKCGDPNDSGGLFGSLQDAETGQPVDITTDIPQEIEELFSEVRFITSVAINRAESDYSSNTDLNLIAIDGNVEAAFEAFTPTCGINTYNKPDDPNIHQAILSIALDVDSFDGDQDAYEEARDALLDCVPGVSDECSATPVVANYAAMCGYAFDRPFMNCDEVGDDLVTCFCNQENLFVSGSIQRFDERVFCTNRNGSDNGGYIDAGDAYLIGSRRHREYLGEDVSDEEPTEPSLPEAVNNPDDLFRCVEDKLLLPIAADIGADIDSYSPERYKQKSFEFRKAIEFGIPIARGDFGNKTAKYCYNPGMTMVMDTAGNQKCYNFTYAGLMRPCQVSVNGVGDEVVMYGLRPSSTAGPPTPYIPPVSSPTSTSHIPLVHLSSTLTNLITYTDHTTPAAGATSAATFTAKDVMAARGGNVGCSQFYELSITPRSGGGTTMSIDITNQDGYDNCIKCIYGGTTFTQGFIDESIVGIDSSGNQIQVTNDPATAVSGGVAPGIDIIPNLEPYAITRQGRLFTELGCIDASSTAGFTNTILRMALGLMGILVILRIIQGALRLRAGDPESVEEGRDVIVSALIALFIVIFSVAILNFIGINILGIPNFSGLG